MLFFGALALTGLYFPASATYRDWQAETTPAVVENAGTLVSFQHGRPRGDRFNWETTVRTTRTAALVGGFVSAAPGDKVELHRKANGDWLCVYSASNPKCHLVKS